jgi:DNA-directed RNA polymerase specialized sigma24 family protein
MEPDHPLAVAFERYGPQLRRYLYTRSSDIHAVDDMLQLTFLEALRMWGRYEDRGFPISSWLFAIARSRLGDLQRERHRRRRETTIDVWRVRRRRASRHTRVVGRAGGRDRSDQRAHNHVPSPLIAQCRLHIGQPGELLDQWSVRC